MRHPTSVAVVAVIAATACQSRTAAPLPEPGASAPAVAAPPPPAAATAGDAELRSLAGRLAFEAAHRPSAGPRLEALVTAAAAAGITIIDTRQYLALTAAAAYCAGGRTTDGLAVAVCEYPDDDAAAAGRAHVEQRYAQLGDGRRIVIHRSATLTTTARAPAQAQTQAALERAFATL